MDGMTLPSDALYGPNCGVTAVAVVAGVPFATAWDMLKPPGRRWKGGTTHAKRAVVLDALGVRCEHRDVHRRMQLKTWVAWYAKPGTTYMVRTTGHVQVVRDGVVLDQRGPVPLAKFWGRNKFVSIITEIMEG